jgi:hypothetical protein
MACRSSVQCVKACLKRLIRWHARRAMSLSQHDCLQQIQSRLDSLQRHQDAFLHAKAAIEIQSVLDSVRSLPEMSAALTKLSSQVTQLAIGNLGYFLSCFSA